MSRYVLQKCRIRDNRIVPQRDCETEVLDWAQLKQRVGCADINTSKMLYGLRRGDYVGTRTRAGKSNVFAVAKTSGHIDWLLKQLPDFPDTVLELYRVEEVVLDTSIREFERRTA